MERNFVGVKEISKAVHRDSVEDVVEYSRTKLLFDLMAEAAALDADEFAVGVRITRVETEELITLNMEARVMVPEDENQLMRL